VTLEPGATLSLAGPQDAAIVASGMLIRPDGVGLRRGALVGPYGVANAGPLAEARTQVRVWILPAFGGIPLLLGQSAAPGTVLGPGVAPVVGVHPPAAYPPLAAPPGPPPSTVDGETDRKFERKLWWLLILLLLFALLLTGSNLWAGPAWGEMPEDRALLHVDRGTVSVTVAGVSRPLGAGDDFYVGRTDVVAVGDHALARLTFRGGGYTVLCGGSQVGIGALSSVGRPIEVSGALDLLDGRVLADTSATSRAFQPLLLNVGTGAGRLANTGPARFAAAGQDVTVAAGRVALDGGTALPVIGGELACGNGQLGAIPVPSTSPAPSDTASPSDSPSPSATPSASASPSPTPTPTATPTRTPSRSPSKSTGPPPPPPVDKTPPTIVNPSLLETLIAQAPPAGAQCAGQKQPFEQIAEGVYADNFTDPDDPIGKLKFAFTWRLNTDGTNGAGTFRLGDGIWAGGFSVPYALSHTKGGTVTVTITAVDPAGNRATATLTTVLDVCIIRQVPG
jgi:putative peptide zinc metalloprotease protein